MPLLSELTTAALTGTGHEQEQAYGLLALGYRAADAIADKHGCHDMSARAVELTRWAAARSGDPQLEMMAAYVRAELFFTGPHPRAGLRTLDTIAGPAPSPRPASRLAMYGALHMRGAVLAARAGMPSEAADRMDEARAAARQVPDGIYHGTAFGPSSIRIHELAAAVESGDIAHALCLTRRWQPPPALPAERRSHFYIEAARAHHWAAHPNRPPPRSGKPAAPHPSTHAATQSSAKPSKPSSAAGAAPRSHCSSSQPGSASPNTNADHQLATRPGDDRITGHFAGRLSG